MASSFNGQMVQWSFGSKGLVVMMYRFCNYKTEL